jgi:hypothetical protein
MVHQKKHAFVQAEAHSSKGRNSFGLSSGQYCSFLSLTGLRNRIFRQPAISTAARCGRKKRAVRGRAGEKLRTAGPESRQWRVREEHF